MRTVVIVSIVILSLFISNYVQSMSLSEEIGLLDGERRSIETERKGLEDRVSKLEDKQCELRVRFADCASQPWWSLLKPRRAEAENEREKLEAQRGEVSKLRRELELTRLNLESLRYSIERKYSAKDDNDEYENQLRKYINEMRSNYLYRLQDELFHIYKQYISGILAYHNIVEGAIKVANKKIPYELFFDNSAELIDMIRTARESIKEILKKRSTSSINLHDSRIACNTFVFDR